MCLAGEGGGKGLLNTPRGVGIELALAEGEGLNKLGNGLGL